MEKITRKGESTKDRIAAVSLALFNEGGYANTSMASIAKAAGMAVGNLCYHYPTKRELVIAQIEQLRQRLWDIVYESRKDGDVVDTFVDIAYATMSQVWDYRFVLRDRLQYGAGEIGVPLLASDPVIAEHAAEIRRSLGRMHDEGLMNSRTSDLDAAAINVWMVARFWWDYLAEREQCDSPTWADQERGFAQLVHALSPHLNFEGRQRLESAFSRYVASSNANLGAVK